MSKNSPEDFLARMLANKVNFLEDTPSGSPVVISSRIRLARNIRGFAFPAAASDESANEVAGLIADTLQKTNAAGASYRSFEINALSDLAKTIFLERHLLSRELLSGKASQMLHVSKDEHLSVMVNEEDHLRIQYILPGYQLHKAWKKINKVDDLISSKLDMAYDSAWGYLTGCPSNVGTAMRISLMLHLPALTMDGSIKQLERGLAKLGLTVRGMFGENSENLGNFYQISNQSTLGESEEEIMDHLARVIDQVIEHEENARVKLLENKRNYLLDKIGRCFGTLRHSYLLSGKEAYQSLSGLRLGVDMNMFNTVDIKSINELLIAISSGHLQYSAGRELSEEERDAFRAQLVRNKLRNSQSS